MALAEESGPLARYCAIEVDLETHAVIPIAKPAASPSNPTEFNGCRPLCSLRATQ
jgi:hypothetical protein